ncbi:MAG: substrate-binding domain-containing protein [Planctomycetes bacterium]|nr:substrate-binding domain-containing protein [Planctomycetota bacterium]
MKLLRALLLGSCSLLAACGDHALSQDASGRYRLVAQFAGSQVHSDACREALERHGTAALVFAHDEATATGPRGIWSSGYRPLEFRLVTIGDYSPDELFPATLPPEERRRAEQTAVVFEETGAAVAVDMALLWCHGITPPRRLPLGTHFVTPGGVSSPQPAPGDFVVELLRRQHADLLTTTPQTDVVFRMGLVMSRADDRHLRVRNQAYVAAKRYPQLDFVDRVADGDGAGLEATVRELLAAGHRAILVSTDDPSALGPIAVAAQERNVALIVLDPKAECQYATCCIGCDQQTLGRAAGEAAKLLAPNGAAIVELADDLQSESAQLRHRGFCDALGLQPR